MTTLTSEIQLKVQLAVGVGVSTDPLIGFTIEHPTLGKIETGGSIASGIVPEFSWVDVTAVGSTDLAVERITVRSCRRSSRMSSFDAGEAQFEVADPDRRWDPVRASALEVGLRGEWVDAAGRTKLRKGTRARIGARFRNEDRWLFTGFVSDWPTALSSDRDAVRTVRLHDWFGILAKTDRVAQPTIIGTGETVSARINRLLDFAGVPASERDITASTVTMQGTYLGGNLLTEIKAAAACDGGDLWVTSEGIVTFRPLSVMMQERRRWAAQMVGTNDAALSSTGAYVSPVEVLPDVPPDIRQAEDIFGRIELARAGGTVQAVEDATILAIIGKATFTRTDFLLETDAQVLALAQAELGLQPREPVGLAEVEIDITTDRQARPHAFDREVGDRIGVRWRDPVLGSTLTREGLVAGITHEIEANKKWRVTFTTQDASNLAPFQIGVSGIEAGNFIAW